MIAAVLLMNGIQQAASTLEPVESMIFGPGPEPASGLSTFSELNPID
jgi:hypothetical protein